MRVPERATVVLFAFLAIACWSVAAARIVTLPEATLVTDVLFDDALYFAVPARHWWQGDGFAFDGLEPTNGVQALWALVTLGLVGCIDEPTLQVRCMVALGGACWGLASLLLARWLHAFTSAPASSLFAGVGMAAAGLQQNLAFHGMENGLQALLGVVVLRVGGDAATKPGSYRRLLALGAALALFALGRTEGALLGVLVGGAFALGWLGRSLRLGQRWWCLCAIATPGLVLVGGNALFQKLHFDSWVPISGSVKQFYEEQWGGVAAMGGALECVGRHFRMIWNLALAPARELVAGDLAALTGMSLRACRNVLWALLALSAAARLRSWWRTAAASTAAASTWSGPARFTVVVAIYGVVHLVVMAMALPHFSQYGTWYFSTEITLVWLALGVLVRPWPRVALWSTAILLGSTALRDPWPAVDPRMHGFRDGGRWIAANVPSGATVGAMSAGLVGWYARDQHVVNLDGLINNRRYLDEFLRRGSFPDYFAAKDITWFADYATRTNWRSGVLWCGHLPASRLVPRYYRRISEHEAYGIWHVLPTGESFELLGDRHGVTRDRFVELAVAADVHARFPVVAAEGLVAALGEHRDHVVARSLFDENSGRIWHVLAPREQLAAIGMTAATVHPAHRDEAVVAPGLLLVGHEVSSRPGHGDPLVAVTLFWTRRQQLAAEPALRLTMIDAEGNELASAAIATCHGSMPAPDWPTGLVVPETVLLRPTQVGGARLVVRGLGDGRTLELGF